MLQLSPSFFYIFFFIPFIGCLGVILLLDKGDYPENWHVVFCPNKQRSLNLSCVWMVYIQIKTGKDFDNDVIATSQGCK